MIMSEKIDSEFIDVLIEEYFQSICGFTKITLIDFTIWDDGEIFFDIKNHETTDLKLMLEEITEIGKIAKLYRDRRTVYLAKNAK